MQGNRSGRRSAVRSGLLTGLSTAAVSGSAAVAGASSSRKFGHGVKTDGFFAAYARLPRARARRERAARRRAAASSPAPRRRARSGARSGRGRSRSRCRSCPRSPCAIAAPHARRRPADGQGPARSAARRELLPWLVPAAAAQVYAGLAASALAALDDYGTAALGFGAGAVAGLVVIVALVGHGVVAFGWGLAVNGAVSLGVPLARSSWPGAALGRPERASGRRLRGSPRASRCPFALQGLYLIAYRFASGLGAGQADDVLLRLPDRLAARGRHGDLDRARLLGPARRAAS